MSIKDFTVGFFLSLASIASVSLASSSFVRVTMAESKKPEERISQERLERARRHASIFKLRRLVDASTEEIAQQALAYTDANYVVLGGKPKVMISQRFTPKEIEEFGFGSSPSLYKHASLTLVVLKGKFDVSNSFVGRVRDRRGEGKMEPIRYITYVFDEEAGTPMITIMGAQGKKMRDLLQDESVPDLPQPVTIPGVEPLPDPPPDKDPAITLPYGSDLPPVKD